MKRPNLADRHFRQLFAKHHAQEIAYSFYRLGYTKYPVVVVLTHIGLNHADDVAMNTARGRDGQLPTAFLFAVVYLVDDLDCGIVEYSPPSGITALLHSRYD